MISPGLLLRLKSEGFEAVDRLIAQSPRAQILRRCSVVRAFNRPLYEEVLSRGIASAPSFEELTKWSEVEPVPRRPDEFRIRDRQQRIAPDGERAWELVDVSRAVAEFLQRHGEERHPERLFQLAAADPAAAKQLFESLYDQADAASDLARGQDILAAVGERYAIVPPDFQALVDDRRTYFRARSLWSEEYYKTKMYLERPEKLGRQLTAFVSGGSKWIANVFAAGGMGKTAAIRWLISRHCALAPRRIPVARIDFDHDDAFKMTTNPPLLLLKLARQFDEQIVGTPFVELRHQLEEIADEDGTAPSGLVQISGYTAELIDRFAGALRTRSGPALIVFDTVEVAMLNRTELNNILDLVAQIQAGAPSLRVLFAGRYTLRGRVDAFLRYETVTETIEIKPFNDPEARDYLSAHRGIKDNDVVTAVISKSGGLPFKLSLFADIIQTAPPPGMSANDIAGYDEVDVVHLIKRIIERVINKQLHWVLRYGAIPRRLTKQFVKDVLSPLLAQAMAGKVDYDDPKRGISDEASKNVFLQDILGSPLDGINVDELWSDLRRYASDQSWISVDPEHPDTMTLHPDVLNPMRRLLEGMGAFDLIHSLAIKYFDDKIVNEPADRLRYAREAIYHRFQAGTADRGEFWRTALTRAIEAGAVNDAREIAAEITGSEYIEGMQPQQRKDGRLVVEPALVADAFLIDAQLLLRRGRMRGNAADWGQAAQSASRGEAFLRLLGRRVDDPRLVSVRAALAIQSGDFETAQTAIDRASSTGPSEELCLLLLRMEIGAAREDLSMMESAAARARELAKGLGFFEPSEPPNVILDRDPRSIEDKIVDVLARTCRETGRLDEALRLYQEWIALHEIRKAPAATWSILVADLLIETGESVAAARIVADIPPHSPAFLLVSAAKRAAFRPHEVFETCRELVEEARRRADLVLLGNGLEEYARLAADLFYVNQSRVGFESALDIFRRIGYHESIARCAEKAARVELYLFGSVDGAQKMIEQLETRSLTAPARARIVSLRMELSIRRGVSAAVSMDEVAALDLHPAGTLILIATAMRAAGSQQERDGWAVPLREALGKISPPSARAILLAPFRHVPDGFSREAGAIVRPLLPEREEAASMFGDEHDAALQQIYVADALRISGEHRAALKALDAAEKVLLPEHPLACLTIDAIRADLGVKVRRSGRVLALLRRDFAAHRELLAMAHLAEAERVTHQPTALELLAQAEEFGRDSEVLPLLIPRIQQRRETLKRGGAKRRAKPPSASAANVRHGDSAGLQRVVDEVARVAAGVAASVSDAPVIDVEISRMGSSATIRNSSAPEVAMTQLPPTKAFGPSDRGDELISHSFVKEVIGNEAQTIERIGEYLFGRQARPPRLPGDLRFVCNELSWNAWPWELALQSRAAQPFAPQIRHFYRARIPNPPTPPPIVAERVIIIRPDVERVLSETRGAKSLVVDDVYVMAGIEPVLLPIEEMEALTYELERAGRAIIHFAVPFSESRSAGTILIGDSKRGVTSGLVAQMIATARTHPLVILDPPLPRVQTEIWRQLLMRNCVAAELARGGEAHTVIAAGLVPVPFPLPLAGLLRSGTSVGALAMALQKNNLTGSGHRLAESIALFTDFPTTEIQLR
jgi:tetratricopeptide (TPR) repeat protein